MAPHIAHACQTLLEILMLDAGHLIVLWILTAGLTRFVVIDDVKRVVKLVKWNVDTMLPAKLKTIRPNVLVWLDSLAYPNQIAILSLQGLVSPVSFKCCSLVDFLLNNLCCYLVFFLPGFPTTQLPIMKIEPGPCNPSPCGHNAECTMLRGRALCRCPSPLQGDPVISCDHRCRRTSDCPKHQVCYNRNNTCVDPCLIYDTGCGVNAVCKVSNHQPSCYCPPGYSGSPYSRCYKKQQQPGDLIFS